MTADEANPFLHVGEVQAWSHTLSNDFLLCRDLGHLWRPATARFNPAENTYDRTMRCGRCHTERTQSLNMRGVVVAGKYAYTEGYTAPKGQGRLTGEARGALRIESVLRLIGQDEGKQ